MSKFSWEKKKVQGKYVYQVMIGGHAHGNPCNSEEEADSWIVALEKKEQEDKKEQVKPAEQADKKVKQNRESGHDEGLGI